MNKTADKQDIRPWHKEQFVWMIIFFPMLAVVAGIYTIYLAIESSDGMVVDDYYKQGLEINRTLERDQKAVALDLAAEVTFEKSLQEVVLTLTANDLFQYPQTMTASFLNATRAGLDQTVNMLHTGRGIYRGQLPALTSGKWYLQLEQDDWRISQVLFIN